MCSKCETVKFHNRNICHEYERNKKIIANKSHISKEMEFYWKLFFNWMCKHQTMISAFSKQLPTKWNRICSQQNKNPINVESNTELLEWQVKKRKNTNKIAKIFTSFSFDSSINQLQSIIKQLYLLVCCNRFAHLSIRYVFVFFALFYGSFGR